MGIGVPTPNPKPLSPSIAGRGQEPGGRTLGNPPTSNADKGSSIEDAPPHASLVPLVLPAALSQRICKA